MKLECKTFSELTNEELYRVLQLRAEVFVVEQNCPYQDPDNYDREALHILGRTKDGIHAYARILPPGVYYKESSIGRVATSNSIRQTGLGRELMKESMRITLEHFPEHSIRIMAQTYLIRFYSDIGFEQVSEEFLEDGLPHVEMLYVTSRP